MRLPSKRRLVSVLQGEEDPEWEYVEGELVHQWGASDTPTKIAAYISFYFRSKENGRGIMLTRPDGETAQIPSSWFHVEKWGEWE